MMQKRFKIWAPLQKFSWDGEHFELSSEVYIERVREQPDLQGMEEYLSKDEQEKMFYAAHWLTFEWTEGSPISFAEYVDLVLLALWLAKPTKTHVAFRFKLALEGASDGAGRCRLLDRFLWIRGTTQNQFNTEDLQAASRYFETLKAICERRERLLNALEFTLAGCMAYRWHTALVSFAAALETMLTYSQEPGLTTRLAETYACLIEAEEAARQNAYCDFKYLYSIRSDIVHGRVYNIDKGDRLYRLGETQNLVRKLWHKIITDQNLLNALEVATKPARRI